MFASVGEDSVSFRRFGLALAELEEHGYIAVKQEVHANSDKPAQMVYINPLAPR